MEASRRRPLHSVIALLEKSPHKFRFFQAVRLLQAKSTGSRHDDHEVGHHRDPRDERLRFEGNTSLRFPSCEILQLSPVRDESETADTTPNAGSTPDLPTRPPQQVALAKRYRMKVNFLGLYGSTGVMPHFDTQRLINAGIRDNVEKAFLDLFNHRAISLFYRIWEKHRFYIGYERNRSAHREVDAPPDSFTEQMQSVFGLGTRGVQNRLAIRDESLLFYAGQMARTAKSAVSLERILNDYFSFPVEVQQFVGQWLELDPSNRSEMPTPQQPLGMNCRLGDSFIVGERVWARDGKFRLRLGPLSYTEFDRILTEGDELRALAQITRMFVGLQYDFDVQLILAKNSVPRMIFDRPGGLSLGNNTWLITTEPENHVDDCIVEVDGYPEMKASI